MANKSEDKGVKTPLVKSSKQVGVVKTSIKGVGKAMDGGLAGILLGVLTSEEQERLTKKVKEVGLKAYKTFEEIQKNFHIVNKPDITTHVPSPTDEDPMATQEMAVFSDTRAKLRLRAKESLEKLGEAFDKAYTSAEESDWDALNKPIKEATGVNADCAKHFETSKSK